MERQGDFVNSKAIYEQALEDYRELESKLGEAMALRLLGGLYWEINQPETAKLLIQQALGLFRELGDLEGESSCLNGMALCYGGEDSAQLRKYFKWQWLSQNCGGLI